MIAHFIDCNCLETCRVGGGPAEDGCESPVLPCIHYISCSTNESFFGFLVGSVQWVRTILQWVWTILQLNFRLVIGIAGLNLQPYIYLWAFVGHPYSTTPLSMLSFWLKKWSLAAFQFFIISDMRTFSEDEIRRRQISCGVHGIYRDKGLIWQFIIKFSCCLFMIVANLIQFIIRKIFSRNRAPVSQFTHTPFFHLA